MLIIIGCLAFILTMSSIFLLLRKDSVDSFETLYEPQNECTPYNLFVEKEEDEFSVIIKWDTVGKCSGFIQYGIDRGELDRVAFDIDGTLRSKGHKVALEKLLTKSKYYFLVNSERNGYGNNGIPLEFVISEM